MTIQNDNNLAIIVAAGSGKRFGSVLPKQFQLLNDKQIIQYSIDYFQNDNRFYKIYLIVSNDYFEYAKQYETEKLQVLIGGETRTQSVFNGLKFAKNENFENVFIHDAARPLINEQIVTKLFDSLNHYDGSVPVLSLSDAIWRVKNSQLDANLNRDELKRIQTPQAFSFKKILEAYENSADKEFVDDALIAKENGLNIGYIEGSENLNKITFNDDIEKLSGKKHMHLNLRIGNGFDAHKFSVGSFITLCGIKIPFEKGLLGHSDADVAWHALVDAILGAMALGDIGKAFPPSDNKYKGADSSIFLEYAKNKLSENNYEIGNIDITIICERPKISKYSQEMIAKTAKLLEISEDKISVKGTTTEKMGFTGREEGIASIVSVIIFGK